MSQVDIEKTCKELVEQLKERRELIYPPNEKRKLPEDIPSSKEIRELRKLIESVKSNMVMFRNVVEPKKRITKPLKLKDSMIEFLHLSPSFGGYYKREFLVRIINLYTTINNLVIPNGIRIDDTLSKATGISSGEEIERKQIFTIVAASFIQTSQDPNQAAQKLSSKIIRSLEKEKQDLDAISKALNYLRRVTKCYEQTITSQHKDILVAEATEWNKVILEARQAFENTVKSTRMFSDNNTIEQPPQPEDEEQDIAEEAEDIQGEQEDIVEEEQDE